ncbi:hypothetical protein NPM18_33740, partial [Bacillus cereus]|nr:hypothetical protein [Bacillus cereus]
PRNFPGGFTPASVREINEQGIPDTEISHMFGRSPSYGGKLKNKWRKQGVCEGPNHVAKKASKDKRGERNVSPFQKW